MGPHAGARPKDIYPNSKQATMQALELDGGLAEAHASLAYVKDAYEWDWAGAEAEYKRAIELNPNYATAHQWYGLHLALLGRVPEAMAEMRKAQELDPLSLIINTNLAQMFYFSRDYETATKMFRKTLELDPNFIFARANLGLVLLKQGHYDHAVVEFERARSLTGSRPSWWFGHLAGAYAKAGKKDEAMKVVAELEQVHRKQYLPPFAITYAYLWLGDQKRALDWLEEAVNDRSAGILYIKPSPTFDPLRSDPRFIDVLRRMGLPQ
jgi:tetratricopeptide (TPR) repeat protein